MNKGQKAGSSPIEFEVEKGKSYAWCVCGKSNKQPFCDGSHKGTDFSPIIVDNEKEGNIAWCGCKATGNSPYCDGTHSKL